MDRHEHVTKRRRDGSNIDACDWPLLRFTGFKKKIVFVIINKIHAHKINYIFFDVHHQLGGFCLVGVSPPASTALDVLEHVYPSAIVVS